MAPDLPPGLRVLVVEDEALVAEELRDRLGRLGLTVLDVVDTGADAVERAYELRPELVLMDIRIKGAMDGVEAAAVIYRELHIPVVFVTAYSDEATLTRARGTAPFGYVLKPFHESHLRVALATAVGRAGTERRFRAHEVMYAATLASIADGVIATDPAGHVTFMNAVAESLTGWRFEGERGCTVSQVFAVVDEETRAPCEPLSARAVREGLAVRPPDRLLLLNKGGSAIPIDASAAPVIDSGGRIAGAVLVFRDIRERRDAEAALARAREQLAHAQRMEAIGRLAGGVAHDFNNLLTIITGCSDLLLRCQLDESARGLVKEIRTASDRAAAVVRQLLAYSRRQVLAPRVIDLNALVAWTERLLQRLLGENIALETFLGPDRCLVRADPSQLEQVVMNLAVNARDAMPRGGCLTIETAAVEFATPRPEVPRDVPPGRYVVLSVRDTGTGVDEAMRFRVFEPFFTTKDVGKGTGLGLATVAGIVEQSGGYVGLQSDGRTGSTFRVYLPAVDEPLTAESSPAEPSMPSVGAGTILLVEDEDGLRSIAATVLRQEGYAVLEARNAETAIAMCQGHPTPIDLVVTDVVMPGMSGRELGKRLESLHPGVPVLYMSGYTDDTVALHGVAVVEHPFLQKPFTPGALTRKVYDVLAQARRAGLGALE